MKVHKELSGRAIVSPILLCWMKLILEFCAFLVDLLVVLVMPVIIELSTFNLLKKVLKDCQKKEESTKSTG